MKKMDSTSLASLPQQEITTGLKRLQEAGITPERWLQMLDADASKMQWLRDSWPSVPVIDDAKDTGLIYDASAMARILGIPCECREPAPKPVDDSIVVYYGGWDLQTLQLCPAGKELMEQGSFRYEKYLWKPEPGYYHVFLPVPNSNRKNWSRQLRHLASINTSLEPTPVCIVAATLLVHLMQTGRSFFYDGCRCAEALPYSEHPVVHVRSGRVRVESDLDHSSSSIWLSATCNVDR